jgi:hypothetical protein
VWEVLTPGDATPHSLVHLRLLLLPPLLRLRLPLALLSEEQLPGRIEQRRDRGEHE